MTLVRRMILPWDGARVNSALWLSGSNTYTHRPTARRAAAPAADDPAAEGKPTAGRAAAAEGKPTAGRVAAAEGKPTAGRAAAAEGNGLRHGLLITNKPIPW